PPREPPRDRQEPAAERLRLLQLAKRLPRLQEGVLHQVLGPRRVAHPAVDGGPDQPRVGADQVLERSTVSRLRSPDEGKLLSRVHWGLCKTRGRPRECSMKNRREFRRPQSGAQRPGRRADQTPPGSGTAFRGTPTALG